jgi:hypothetical protein
MPQPGPNLEQALPPPPAGSDLDTYIGYLEDAAGPWLKGHLEPLLQAQFPRDFDRTILAEMAEQKEWPSKVPSIVLKYLDFYSFVIATRSLDTSRGEWVRPAGSGSTTGPAGFTTPQAALKEFRSKRDEFTNSTGGSVANLLEQISKVPAGRALLAEFTGGVNKVRIRPDVAFMYSGDAKPESYIENVSAFKNMIRAGMPILNVQTDKPANDATGKPMGSGLGVGESPRLNFSPEAFQKGSPSKLSGPGTEPDEILFHELVHALRQIKGLMATLSVNQNYLNEEEYLAIVISNIYIRSARKSADLRGDHRRSVLKDPDHFLDNPQGVNLTQRVLLERFYNWQPKLFDRLAKLSDADANFNPVKTYDQERRKSKK